MALVSEDEPIPFHNFHRGHPESSGAPLDAEGHSVPWFLLVCVLLASNCLRETLSARPHRRKAQGRPLSGECLSVFQALSQARVSHCLQHFLLGWVPAALFGCPRGVSVGACPSPGAHLGSHCPDSEICAFFPC